MAAAIGIIGGSGLYEMEGLSDVHEVSIPTPFGMPSDSFVVGTLEGRKVVFVPRHGRGHRHLPTEVPHQANIWALRSLGVRYLISVSAVGSLKEDLHPEDVLIVDQFFDRTSRREHHTFFGKGIAGHVSFADPTSHQLNKLLADAANELVML
jgi:5'-methylthioadenosine phosphorylase